MLNLANQKFRLFAHNDDDAGSLSGNLILQVLGDKKGRIWVGTVNDGMNLFNPVNNSFYKYQPKRESPGSLSNTTVSAIYADEQG